MGRERLQESDGSEAGGKESEISEGMGKEMTGREDRLLIKRRKKVDKGGEKRKKKRKRTNTRERKGRARKAVEEKKIGGTGDEGREGKVVAEERLEGRKKGEVRKEERGEIGKVNR